MFLSFYIDPYHFVNSGSNFFFPVYFLLMTYEKEEYIEILISQREWRCGHDEMYSFPKYLWILKLNVSVSLLPSEHPCCHQSIMIMHQNILIVHKMQHQSTFILLLLDLSTESVLLAASLHLPLLIGWLKSRDNMLRLLKLCWNFIFSQQYHKNMPEYWKYF